MDVSGAVISTIMVTAAESGDIFPAASIARATAECVPSARLKLSQAQLPKPFAVVEQRTVTPLITVTVASASAVPEKVGVVSLVLLPVLGEAMTGALGAVVSTVQLADA